MKEKMMRKKFLPFSKPSISVTEIEAVAEVLRSDCICSLPLFSDTGLEDVDDVVDAIKEILA